MINPAQKNLDPRRRGFQDNGAPTGYGQQQGASPFLDRSQQPGPPPVPEDGRMLASAPGQFRPMGPLDAPPYMQALEGRHGASVPKPDKIAGTDNMWAALQMSGGGGIEKPGTADKTAAGIQLGGAATAADMSDALSNPNQPTRQAHSASYLPMVPQAAPPLTPLASIPAAAAPAAPAASSAPRGKAQIAPVGAMNNMQGFDNANWADPDMDSVKYAHGRLANGITRPSEMAKLVASEAYQKRFPGATFDGKDRVHFNGALSDGVRGGIPVGAIDVLRAANKDTDSSEGGWWGPLEEAAAEAAGQDPEEARRLQMALATQRPTAGAPQSVNIQDIIAQLVADQQQAR